MLFTLATNLSYTVILTTSFFTLALLNHYEQVLIYQYLVYQVQFLS